MPNPYAESVPWKKVFVRFKKLFVRFKKAADLEFVVTKKNCTSFRSKTQKKRGTVINSMTHQTESGLFVA